MVLSQSLGPTGENCSVEYNKILCSYLGSNPDISQNYKMGNISKGVANTSVTSVTTSLLYVTNIKTISRSKCDRSHIYTNYVLSGYTLNPMRALYTVYCTL
jgi:hypothetical protein